MTQLACKIEGCDYEGTPQGLRSHLHGRKDDEHVNAAADRRHHDWYPTAYGLDEEDSADEGDNEGNDTPTETPSEGGNSDPSEEGTGEEGTDTRDPDPSDGSTESPDEEDEYAAQWEGAETPSDDPSQGGDLDPSEEGTGEEGADTHSTDPSEGEGMGFGTALVLGTGALAVAVLLRGGESGPSDEGTESPDATNPGDTHEVGPEGASGWEKSTGEVPLEGTDTDDMEFTPTET
ncbi:hypothetical protein [Halorubrum salinum]|uniref:hypothetical protein n=1 Tax=Halorubrum salinum TaxID=767517 RepID=UPI002112AAA8|nr:hypothetical protein [Halorubrum salinum]